MLYVVDNEPARGEAERYSSQVPLTCYWCIFCSLDHLRRDWLTYCRLFSAATAIGQLSLLSVSTLFCYLPVTSAVCRVMFYVSEIICHFVPAQQCHAWHSGHIAVRPSVCPSHASTSILSNVSLKLFHCGTSHNVVF